MDKGGRIINTPFIDGEENTILSRTAWKRWLLAVLLLLAILFGEYHFWPQIKVVAMNPNRLDQDPWLGSPNAPVTVMIYTDYACEPCRNWEQSGMIDQVFSEYGDKVRFVWRDFPTASHYSVKADVAAQCAFDQGQFLAFHELLFEKFPALDVSSLKKYAAQTGLDMPRFNQCLDTSADLIKVQYNWQDALSRGFRLVPSFLINGQRYSGPIPYDQLKMMIDNALAGN